MDDTAHIAGLAQFLDKKSARRFGKLAAIPKRRHDIADMLCHKFWPESKYIIDCAKATKDEILLQLRQLKSPENVFVFGASCVPGMVMNLSDAVSEIYGYAAGQIVSCVPGKLAFFEGEDIGDRMILCR